MPPLEKRIDCFKKLIDYTGDLPVKFAIENHDNMTFSAMQFLRFLNTVDSDKLGVTFDATNFRCMKDDPLEAYHLLKDRVFHAHLKGAHTFEDRVIFDHTMDRDDFNWLGLLKKMKQSYRGVYALESLFPQSAEESTVKNIAYFKSLEERV